MPYVVSTLLAAVELPARYNETPAAAATVTLPVPRLTTINDVPTGQLTALLSATVKVEFDELVE